MTRKCKLHIAYGLVIKIPRSHVLRQRLPVLKIFLYLSVSIMYYSMTEYYYQRYSNFISHLV
jgi:hypothetical protein